MNRAMPASSRVALKYPTSVRYGSAASPHRSISSCPAAISTSATRISAVVSRTPVVLSPMYRRPGYSRETGCSVEKNVFPTSRTCGGKIVVSRPYRARTCSAAFRAVAVDATTRGRTGRPDASPPRAQRIDGDLEQPDRRPERAGDQVQLVLDDQVRRPEPGHGPPVGRSLRVLAARRRSCSYRSRGARTREARISPPRSRRAPPPRPPAPAGRTCPRSRSRTRAPAGRSPHPPSGRAAPRPPTRRGRTGSRPARRRSTRRRAGARRRRARWPR